MITPIHHVSLTVRDLDRSVSFYEHVLGMRCTMRSPISDKECRGYLRLPEGIRGRMAMLQANDGLLGHIELVEIDPPPSDPSPPKRPGDPGLWMMAFQVVGESVGDVQQRLKTLGVTFWSELTTIELDGYPTFQALLIEDPDGTVLELLQLPTPEEVRAHRRALRDRD